MWLRNTKTGGWFEIPDDEYINKNNSDKEKQIAANKSEANEKNSNENNIDPEIKDFVDEAIETMKRYGFGRVIINETKGSSLGGDYGKAENPVNKLLEKKLVEWGSKNGYSVSFQTDKKNSSGVKKKLKYGYQQEKRTQKQRIMFVRRVD